MDKTPYHPSTHPSICASVTVVFNGYKPRFEIWSCFFFPLIILCVWSFFMPLLLVHFFCCLQNPFLLIVFLQLLVVFLRASFLSVSLHLYFSLFSSSSSLLRCCCWVCLRCWYYSRICCCFLCIPSAIPRIFLCFFFHPLCGSSWKRVSRNKQVFLVRRSFR